MKKLFLFLIVTAFCVQSQVINAGTKYQPLIDNSRLMMIDSLWVTGLDTAQSSIYWLSRGNEKSVEISVDDTSSAGTTADSACVDVLLYQGFDRLRVRPYYMQPNKIRYHLSTAYTDGKFFDSLDIADMDTLEMWQRDSIPVVAPQGDTTSWVYTNTLASIMNSDACSYKQLVPDYSPSTMLRIIGLSPNKKGSAVLVVIRYYQQQALKTRDN